MFLSACADLLLFFSVLNCKACAIFTASLNSMAIQRKKSQRKRREIMNEHRVEILGSH